MKLEEAEDCCFAPLQSDLLDQRTNIFVLLELEHEA
jgi:hypothetical protein